MAKYDLKGLQGSSMYQLSELVGVITNNMEWSKFGTYSRQVCDHFLTLAAASLLADFKPDKFFLNCARSTENFRRFLLTAQQHYQQRPSLMYSEPVYAAIVSQQTALLKPLQDALPTSWQSGEEYQHSYLIPSMMLQLAINDSNTDQIVANKIPDLLACEPEPTRANLFISLFNLQDQTEKDFWDHFETALLLREQEIQAKVQSVTTKISEFIAHRFIWFEGLAWLTLAKQRGFKLPSKHLSHCPDEALITTNAHYSGDWPLIPLPNGQY